MANEATINLLPKQTDAWDAWEDPKITEIGYGGAAGGGKTRLGWYLAITICEMYPGAKCVVGRKELKNLRLTTLVELWTIFKELGYQKDRDYKFNASDHIIKFPNGSEVLCVDTAISHDDPEYTRFGSLPVSFLWLDESNESPDKGVSILKTRVGRANIFTVNGKTIELKAMTLETFNPNKGRVYRTYYKPWKNNALPSYRVFIPALPGDNPHLPAVYIENLKRSDKTTRERLLNGNFDYDDDPQKIMNYSAITDLPLNPLQETKESKKKYIVCDVARFGGDKIVIGTFKGLTLYSLGVYAYQGTDETVKKIRDEAIDEQVPYTNIIADEDGVGGGVIDNMKGIKGFSGNASPTLIWNDIAQKMVRGNYQNFRSECYFKLADLVNNRLMKVDIKKFQTNIEGYTVEQAVEELFEELDAIKERDNSGDQKRGIVPKIELKEQLGRSPDFADIVMMRMTFEFPAFPTEEDPMFYQPKFKGRKEPRINKAR